MLGSLPGEQSLASARYYANPRNQFWRLIGAVIERDVVQLPYEARLETLLQCGLGLWDSVQSASRSGSLDGAIRNHTPNDLERLIRDLPRLCGIGFNGGAAARIGIKAMGCAPAVETLVLPSSSPAFTLPFEEKRRAWLQLRSWL